MKFFIALFSIVLISANCFAANDLRIGSNGSTKNVEIRFNSKFKKNKAVVVSLKKADGTVLFTQNSQLLCGDNRICLNGAINLPEGEYTVTMVSGKKTYSTKFLVWN